MPNDSTLKKPAWKYSPKIQKIKIVLKWTENMDF